MKTEEDLIRKYCSLIRQYVQEKHYVLDREEESEFGSWYFVIKKSNDDGAWTKVRVSNHQCKFDDLDLQFRVDLNSLKRPPSHLKEKVFKSLDKAINKACLTHCKKLLNSL